MSDMFRKTAAEAVLPGVLKLTWNAGYEGTVDLCGTIADGEIFEPIRNPEDFNNVRVADYGHNIYWGDADDGVDFGCDRLRETICQTTIRRMRAAVAEHNYVAACLAACFGKPRRLPPRRPLSLVYRVCDCILPLEVIAGVCPARVCAAG
jgi:hypothetical protein